MNRVFMLLFLLLAVATAAKAPVPFCHSRPLYKEGPLAYEEKLTHDMDDAFSGYNLDIELVSNNSFARMNKKFLQLDRMNTYLPNLITHHIEHNANGWGKESFLLHEDLSGNIVFVYGLMEDSMHVPRLDFSLPVGDTKNEKCFGAALFLDYGLAVIDCMKINSDNSFQNFFLEVDLANHSISKRIENPMFVKFTEITQRKILRFKDPQTGYVYLLRAYEAQGVDMDHRGNTYMEIFSARDPTDLELIRVVDRTYIHAKTLSITDIKVYLGDIFFLDYLNGLYRLDILRNQDIAITARYNKDGFMKFGVYSDNLQDELIIALANPHAVYEIDWANVADPVTINKYSLIEHSHVRSVTVTDRYLLVQSAANVTDQSNADHELDYTWVFTKGSRTYMNAYHIINHNSSKVEIDFNAQKDEILIADESGIGLYQLDQARITLQLTEESKIGKTEDIVIIATSSDPNSNETFKCQEKITIHMVRKEDMTIYPIGLETTTKYSSNFPGEVHIPLRNYVRGPNITVSVVNTTAKHEIPAFWFDKLNETKITADFKLNGIIFFHTQVVPKMGEENIIYYAQDSEYRTHVINCYHIWEDAEAICTQSATFPHTSKIHAFATSFFGDGEGFNYFYIIVFKANLKNIEIIDFSRHERLLNITYVGHQEAEITDIATSNGFLYVLRGMVKTIDVYRLSDCQEKLECKPDFFIDAETLKPLGIDYFSPVKLVTDFMHP